jgi:dihydrofolate reductase
MTSLWAQTRACVIGRGGSIPWRYPGDFRRFKRLTLGAVVIMGRKTYESIGRPLPGRTNLVVTSTWAPIFATWVSPPGATGDATTFVPAKSLPDALDFASKFRANQEVFFIGGARIYAAAMPFAHALDVTIVPDVVVANGLALVHAPVIDRRVWRQDSEEPHPDAPGLIVQRWERR